MLKKMDSLTRLKNYMMNKDISIDLQIILKNMLVHSDELRELPDDIIIRIIAEAYGLDKNAVDKFSDYIEKLSGRRLLWIQKEYIKRYIDYNEEEDYLKFKELTQEFLPEENIWKPRLEQVCGSYTLEIKDSDKSFIKMLREEIQKNNHSKVQDYIMFLYSRLVGLNERYFISLKQLFDENKSIIKQNLSKWGYEHLMDFCQNKRKIERMGAVKKFSEEYLKVLRNDDNSNQKKSLIYFNIDQSMLDNSKSLSSFYDNLLRSIRYAYKNLQNHKTLSVRIQNIINNNINIKWEIYSIIITYAETFNVYEEKRSYYSPWELCKDYLEHRYNIAFGNEETSLLRAYFKDKKDFTFGKIIFIFSFYFIFSL